MDALKTMQLDCTREISDDGNRAVLFVNVFHGMTVIFAEWDEKFGFVQTGVHTFMEGEEVAGYDAAVRHLSPR